MIECFEGGEETVLRLGSWEVDFGEGLGQLPHVTLVPVLAFTIPEHLFHVNLVVLVVGLL
jgi:hypothetical protein